LTEEVAGRTDSSKEEAQRCLDNPTEVVVRALKAGEEVRKFPLETNKVRNIRMTLDTMQRNNA
jgi:nucleoid DNA-binding protein